jgi:hypothetical protein
MKDISDAIFRIVPIKAPGPDGFHSILYHRNWELLRGDLTHVVAHFFAKRVMPMAVDDTSIVLVSKIVKRPDTPIFRQN